MTTTTPARSDLLDAYTRSSDPVATVYVPSPSAVEDAEQQLDIRTKNAVAELEALDAPAEIVEHCRQALAELDHGGGAAHLIVADRSGVLLSTPLARPLRHALTRLGPTPQLLPLVSATQTDRRHLAVIVDRTGADVILRDGVGAPIDHLDVDGPDVRVHRGAPGGWSQKRFQQTAENAWETNAKEVVDQITDEFPDVDLVVYGGDVRSVGFFAEHLPPHIHAYEVDGSRHSDPDAFLDEVDVVLRTIDAAEVAALLDQWKEAHATGTGTTGLAVLDDLTHGRVEHLLVVDDTTDDKRLRTRIDFAENVHRPEDSESTETPVTEGAIALALATGADVTVVPTAPGIEDNVAAVLRF